MKTILSLGLIFCFLSLPSAFSARSELAPGPIRIQVSQLNGKFRFQLCDVKGKCEALGRDQGYTRQELERWNHFRPSGWRENLPLLGSVVALPAWVFVLVVESSSPVFVTAASAATLTTIPFALVAAGGLAIVGVAYYSFKTHPQMRAEMPNDVYSEFSSRPELLEKLKRFLREVDEGVSVSSDPRILSDRRVEKSAPVSSSNIPATANSSDAR